MRAVLIFIISSLVALNVARDINDKSLNFIKDHEKWMSCAYRDSGGKLTIGYGHLIESGDGFNVNSCITKEKGLALLRIDLSTATKCIGRIVNVPLGDNQFGALVSWIFNVGCQAARISTLVKKLNDGKPPNEVCTELRRWNRNGGKVVPGLVNRRKAECTLYKS